MSLKAFFKLIGTTFENWREDHAARLAAALAYYTTFSLVPLLVVVIALAGLFGRGNIAEDQILWLIENWIGVQGRIFIKDMIQSASQPSSGIAATAMGGVTLLFGALGTFNELQTSLNTIWKVKPKPLRGLKANLMRLLVRRLLSFAMILGIGFLLLLSFLMNAALVAFQKYLGNLFPLSTILVHILNFAVPLGVFTLLFAMMFRILPDAWMAWRDIWLGAVVTSLLFTVGKVLIAQYLGTVRMGATFGAAGFLVVILVWIYYSAQIIFLGAEFTRVYAHQHGAKIMPDEVAVSI